MELFLKRLTLTIIVLMWSLGLSSPFWLQYVKKPIDDFTNHYGWLLDDIFNVLIIVIILLFLWIFINWLFIEPFRKENKLNK